MTGSAVESTLQPAMSALAGIALLPDADASARLVDLAERWRDEIDDPRPGTTTNLPHVSIHQFPTTGIDQLVTDLAGLGRHRPGTSTMSTLSYQPVGWLFAGVARRPWMDSLQVDVVQLVDRFVDRAALRPAAQLQGYTAAEATSYLRHGYRYVGETFRPHVTLGRTTSDRLALPASCCADYDAEILGRTVRFDRLVVYRAGPFGRLVEVIADL